MRIAYGPRSYERDQLPEFTLRNMFAEESPTEETGVVLISRKGLVRADTWGSSAVRNVFRQANVFNGDRFAVVGSDLYREGVLVGPISGDGPVSFAAGSTNELAIAAGGPIYRYDGATLVAVTFPDTANVRKILFHDGLYIAVKSEDHKFYWSAVLDADTWDALDFASAESKPDTLLDAEVLADTLWLFGQETTEPWANTGDATLPYQRIELALLSKGIHSTGALVEMDQGLHFVGNDNTVYSIRGGSPQRISDHAMEQQIAASTNVGLFGFSDEGHAFICIRLDDVTHVIDLATNLPTEFTSYSGNWLASCSTAPGTEPLFGGDSGHLYTLGGWTDDDGSIERLLTAGIPLEAPLSVDNLRVHVNVGNTELLVGQGSDPVIELRSSTVAGRSWGNWVSTSLGMQGDYRARPQWRRLGMFDPPGALFQIRVTDPVPFRLSGVFINEVGGGRSR